nr:hypothetical protein CFP56_34899 [Quercus suber]
MADYSDATGSPRPHSKSLHEKKQGTSCAKKPRNRKPNQNQSIAPQFDGTGSDSVTTPLAAPRSRKQPKQKPHAQAHISNGRTSRHDVHDQRRASVGTVPSPATPLKEQAYAGPTFQASPAPSSLPVPRFFSKSASVPNAAVPPGGHQRMQSQSAVSEQSSPESDDVVLAPARDANHSPLDLFFKADRAERERSKSSGQMLSPEFSVIRPRPPITDQDSSSQQSVRNVFLRELDGEGQELPSAKQILDHDLSRPEIAGRPQSSPDAARHTDAEKGRNEAYTKSLKELLFSNISTTPPQQQYRSQSNPSPFYNGASPQRVASSPSTPVTHSGAEQNGDFTPLYGNRKNLSPLFKAAREDTPPRPSSLRQELHNDSRFGAIPQTTLQPPLPQPSRPTDPNAFSRQYLDEQIAAGQQAHKHHYPFTMGPKNGMIDPGSLSDSAVMHSTGHQPQRHHQQPPPPSQSSLHQDYSHQLQYANPPAPKVFNPFTAPGTKDLSAMSDDLHDVAHVAAVVGIITQERIRLKSSGSLIEILHILNYSQPFVPHSRRSSHSPPGAMLARMVPRISFLTWLPLDLDVWDPTDAVLRQKTSPPPEKPPSSKAQPSRSFPAPFSSLLSSSHIHPPPAWPVSPLSPQVGADLVGADELLVLVDDGPPEGALEDDDRGEDEAGPDLDERDGADPDLAVGEGEGHDVVDERLDLAAAGGDAEGVGQELLEQAGVGELVEGGVEGEDGAGALEAVAGEVELLHSVHVLAVQLDGGAVGRLGEPDVEVLALAGLEEHDVVAVVEVGELVELRELGLGVELGILAAVRQQRVEIGEEVAVSAWRKKEEAGAGDSWVSYRRHPGRELDRWISIGRAFGRRKTWCGLRSV